MDDFALRLSGPVDAGLLSPADHGKRLRAFLIERDAYLMKFAAQPRPQGNPAV